MMDSVPCLALYYIVRNCGVSGTARSPFGLCKLAGRQQAPGAARPRHWPNSQSLATRNPQYLVCHRRCAPTNRAAQPSPLPAPVHAQHATLPGGLGQLPKIRCPNPFWRGQATHPRQSRRFAREPWDPFQLHLVIQRSLTRVPFPFPTPCASLAPRLPAPSSTTPAFSCDRPSDNLSLSSSSSSPLLVKQAPPLSAKLFWWARSTPAPALSVAHRPTPKLPAPPSLWRLCSRDQLAHFARHVSRPGEAVDLCESRLIRCTWLLIFFLSWLTWQFLSSRPVWRVSP